LLNTLTNSEIVAEDKLFATLDPTSRRLRFPAETEVIITDTVGFIRNLPAELLKAFMATLEELKEADLLIHVVDISNPAYHDQMNVVEKFLRDLDLENIPCLKLYNKVDLLEKGTLAEKVRKEGGLLVSALQPETLKPFLLQAERIIGKELGGDQGWR